MSLKHQVLALCALVAILRVPNAAFAESENVPAQTVEVQRVEGEEEDLPKWGVDVGIGSHGVDGCRYPSFCMR